MQVFQGNANKDEVGSSSHIDTSKPTPSPLDENLPPHVVTGVTEEESNVNHVRIEHKYPLTEELDIGSRPIPGIAGCGGGGGGDLLTPRSRLRLDADSIAVDDLPQNALPPQLVALISQFGQAETPREIAELFSSSDKTPLNSDEIIDRLQTLDERLAKAAYLQDSELVNLRATLERLMSGMKKQEEQDAAL